MIDTKTVRSWTGTELKAGGLRRTGSVWRVFGEDVQWVVHVDHLPFGRRLGVDIGLDLQAQSSPKLPTDCQILLHLENLAAAKDRDITAALDLDSGLDDVDRRSEIEGAVRGLAVYLLEHLTLPSVRRAHRRGDFDSGFIQKGARAVLQAGDPR